MVVTMRDMLKDSPTYGDFVMFDRKELKSRKGRIEEMISGEMAGEAARAAVETMQAVVLMSTITTATVIH